MKWLFLTTLVIMGWTSDVANSWLLPKELYLSELNADPEVTGELWAILVAGSSGWWNYRHQADVCHAYQILRKHKVPDDHIIVMMFDDIAHNPENPYPGVIINKPGGPNVYENILKDYTGKEVTPENFLNILKGNSSAMAGIGSGKVVKSSPNDRVFINLVDHGAPGIFAFPDEYLRARALAETIDSLHEERKFGEIVIYVESCESGSLFQGLPHNDRTYAVTASSPDEPSYACYLDDKLHTYLGDVFSVKWMEDTDRENINRKTLQYQFNLVKREVTTSTVMEWGEENISRQKLCDFMGERASSCVEKKDLPSINSIRYYDDEDASNLEASRGHDDDDDAGDEVDKVMRLKEDECTNSAVASPDVPVAILESRVKGAKNNEEKEFWKKELTTLHLRRLLVHVVMRSLVKDVTQDDELALKMSKKGHQNITNWKCYEQVVDTFHEKCFNLGENPFSLRVLYMLVNLCEHGYTAETFKKSADYMCTHPKFTEIY